MRCLICCDRIDGDPIGIVGAGGTAWICSVHREMLTADPEFAARFADRIRALIARSEKTTAPVTA